MARRCICGQSTRFPICDGEHGGADWACEADALRETPEVFVAGPHLANLAERLAFERGGLAAHRHPGSLRAARVTVLSDGTDLPHLHTLVARVEAATRRLIAVDIPSEALGHAFSGWAAQSVIGREGLALYAAVAAALDEHAVSTRPPLTKRLFVSHAVADEPTLQTALDQLRGPLGLDVFACADSIPSGARWRAEIEGALRGCDVLVFIASESAAQSTWCAFEAGFAMALELPVAVVSLDGSLPPGFLAHIQMQDVPRTLARRPWLSRDEALLEAILAAVA